MGAGVDNPGVLDELGLAMDDRIPPGWRGYLVLVGLAIWLFGGLIGIFGFVPMEYSGFAGTVIFLILSGIAWRKPKSRSDDK